MPFSDNKGVRIHYEVRGSGPPIIFNHGFPRDRTSWYAYADLLQDSYQCIMPDQRGMGLSDKPHDIDAYTFERKVSDILSVLDDLGIEKAVYWGFSMGGGIGWAAARYAPERFHAFVIGGSEPFRRDADREGIRTSAARIRANPESHPGQDVEALYASQMASAQGANFEDVLPTMTMPSLVYVGEDDTRFASITEAAALIPNVTFFTLPGRDHSATHREAAGDVVAQAKPFLTRVMSGVEALPG
jgi:pimeloyl-ACP methyl ester carboxylesterase